MTPRRRPLVFLLALIVVMILATTVSAEGGSKRVALVIQFPDRTYTEIVTVPEGATTADVLEAAVIPVGMAKYSWGTGLCNINGVGNPVDDCFADPAHYWAYFHLNSSQWEVGQTGVDGYKPADKAVEGFAWSGFDEQYNPTIKPPVMTFDQIEEALTPPSPNEVPEPATILLLGGGLTALAGYARKRRAARA